MPTENALIAVHVYLKSNVLCYLRHLKTEFFIHLPLCWFCTTHKSVTNKEQTSEEIIKPVKIYGHEDLLQFLGIIYLIIFEW